MSESNEILILRALVRHAIAHCEQGWRHEGRRLLPAPCRACRELAQALGLEAAVSGDGGTTSP
jgi:hypothetical protein